MRHLANRVRERSERGLAWILSARPLQTSPQLVSNLPLGRETCIRRDNDESLLKVGR